jgi:hypothetical protein
LSIAAAGRLSGAIHSHPTAHPSAPVAALDRVPVITFDAMAFDFGKIPPEKPVVHSFRVFNAGQATLQLEDVKPVCGCTTTVVGKTKLAPGESTEIQAVFAPEPGFSGVARKTIVVVSNDPAHPTLTLRFSADVLAPPPGQDQPASAPAGSDD